MKMGKYFWTGVLVVLIMVLTLSGCSPTDTENTAAISQTNTDSDIPVDGGTFRMIQGSGPSGSLGLPDKMTGTSSSFLAACIETLINMSASGTAYPVLAESYAWSSDNLTLTLNLRHNVKFHDGSDFNAEAVIWNLDRYVAAGVQGSNNIQSYKALDSYTVQIVTKQYNNTWFGNLGLTLGSIISPSWVAEKGEDYVNWNPVGTGPFKFKEYVDNDHLTFVRNDNYWGDRPHLDAIEYLFIADPTTAQIAFENGEGDVISLATSTGGPRMALDLSKKGYVVSLTQPTMYQSLVPSVRNPDSPLSNLKVREAVEYALDKEAIVQNIGKGYYTAWYQFSGITQSAYDPSLPAREYDPDKAKQLLIEAGYPDGIQTHLIVCTAANDDHVPAIQSYLKEVGIDVDIQLVSVEKWIDMETNGWDEGILQSPLGYFGELYGKCVDHWLVTPDTPNWEQGLYWDSLYRPSELVQACNEYLSLQDEDALASKGREIVKILNDNACFIMLWGASGITVMEPYVQDMRKDYDDRSPNIWNYTAAWMQAH
jgi:ABC-type transport system substrate-binding protein